MTGSFKIDFETNLLINYDVFQVYEAGDPSICEVFFTATFVILLKFFISFRKKCLWDTSKSLYKILHKYSLFFNNLKL